MGSIANLLGILPDALGLSQQQDPLALNQIGGAPSTAGAAPSVAGVLGLGQGTPDDAGKLQDAIGLVDTWDHNQRMTKAERKALAEQLAGSLSKDPIDPKSYEMKTAESMGLPSLDEQYKKIAAAQQALEARNKIPLDTLIKQQVGTMDQMYAQKWKERYGSGKTGTAMAFLEDLMGGLGGDNKSAAEKLRAEVQSQYGVAAKGASDAITAQRNGDLSESSLLRQQGDLLDQQRKIADANVKNHLALTKQGIDRLRILANTVQADDTLDEKTRAAKISEGVDIFKTLFRGDPSIQSFNPLVEAIMATGTPEHPISQAAAQFEALDILQGLKAKGTAAAGPKIIGNTSTQTLNEKTGELTTNSRRIYGMPGATQGAEAPDTFARQRAEALGILAPTQPVKPMLGIGQPPVNTTVPAKPIPGAATSTPQSAMEKIADEIFANPDNERLVPTDRLSRMSVERIFRDKYGLPLPKPAGDADRKLEQTSRNGITKIDRALEILQDKDLWKRIGPVMGRVGVAEAASGATLPDMSPADTEKMKAFQDSLNYIYFIEGQNLLKGRPSTKLMEVLKNSSPRVTETLPMLVGDLKQVKAAALDNLKGVENTRFGGSTTRPAWPENPSADFGYIKPESISVNPRVNASISEGESSEVTNPKTGKRAIIRKYKGTVQRISNWY